MLVSVFLPTRHSTDCLRSVFGYLYNVLREDAARWEHGKATAQLEPERIAKYVQSLEERGIGGQACFTTQKKKKTGERRARGQKTVKLYWRKMMFVQEAQSYLP